jgi:spore germination cell wall hydrolase CwlJ-like protein
MKRSRTVIDSIAVAALAMAMMITAVTGNGVSVADSTAAMTQTEKNGIAGVAVAMNTYEEAAAAYLEDAVSVEAMDIELLTANGGDEDASTGEELTEEEAKWQNKLMAKVDDFLYVRAKADGESEIIGKMYKGAVATIKKEGTDWTKITSGNVEGYVSNDYCVTGAEALAYAEEICDTVAKVTTDGLRVREEQSTDSRVITIVSTGDKLLVNTEADTEDEWVAVQQDSETYYVSSEYVTVSLKTKKAVTLKEEAAAQKAAALKAASKSSGSSVSVTADEETLLAAIIQCEAEGQSMNGMIAVGAVVLNRVRSSSFPNTISKVIYQSGQFGPASSGKLARRLARGVSSSARQAAKAALNGSDPTGGAKYFKMASSGHAGVVIGPVVFY